MDGLSSNLLINMKSIFEIYRIGGRLTRRHPVKIRASFKFLLSYLYNNIILKDSQLVKKIVPLIVKIFRTVIK